MNLILLEAAHIDAHGEAPLTKRVQEHLKNTLRSRDGDILRVGVLNGQKGCGQLSISASGEYRLRLLPLSFREPQQVLAFMGVHMTAAYEPAEIRDTNKLNEEKAQAATQINMHDHTDTRSAQSQHDIETETQDALQDGDTKVKMSASYEFPILSPTELALWHQHPYRLNQEALTSSPDLTPQTIPYIDVLLALPRPRVFDKLLQYLSSMSIGRATFFASSRSDLAYFSSPKTRESNMIDSIRLGLEQGLRTVAPKVSLAASLQGALMLMRANEETGKGEEETQRAARCMQESDGEAERHLVLIAHPYAVEVDGVEIPPRNLLETCILSHNGPVLLVLGPEGGFCESEVRELLASLSNAHLVHLGRDILRCEVAAIALISQVQLLTSQSPLREKPAVRITDPSAGNHTIAIPIPGRRKRPTPD